MRLFVVVIVGFIVLAFVVAATFLFLPFELAACLALAYCVLALLSGLGLVIWVFATGGCR